MNAFSNSIQKNQFNQGFNLTINHSRQVPNEQPFFNKNRVGIKVIMFDWMEYNLGGEQVSDMPIIGYLFQQ